MGFPGYGAPVSLTDAKKIAAAAEVDAVKLGLQMVIVVLDSGGNLVLLHRMDDSHLGSLYMAEEKAKTAIKFRRSSKDYEDMVAKGGVHLRMLSAEPVLAIEGGLPILRDGKIIGALGISGGTAAEDGQVAAAGLAGL
jgi:uncharacterized protein GlcG (DUF336 family)